MNQFILVAMNRENHTQAELDANTDEAASYAKAANETYFAAAYAFYALEASSSAAYFEEDVEYWIGRYFEVTGEDLSEYEQEIKRRNE